MWIVDVECDFWNQSCDYGPLVITTFINTCTLVARLNVTVAIGFLMIVAWEIFLALFNSHWGYSIFLFLGLKWWTTPKVLFVGYSSSVKNLYSEQFKEERASFLSFNILREMIVYPNDKEPTNHLILHCDCSSRVQSDFRVLYGASWAFPKSLDDFISCWCSESSKKKWVDYFGRCCLLQSWSLWWNRWHGCQMEGPSEKSCDRTRGWWESESLLRKLFLSFFSFFFSVCILSIVYYEVGKRAWKSSYKGEEIREMDTSLDPNYWSSIWMKSQKVTGASWCTGKYDMMEWESELVFYCPTGVKNSKGEKKKGLLQRETFWLSL